jgi:predicted signal transduction protein with EAL and GGDEF domain
MAGLESDEARQAMIVGICHFAHVTGCRLIVEGIETDSELTVLRALTIELGQGYLLGRPAGRGRLAEPLASPETPDGVGVLRDLRRLGLEHARRADQTAPACGVRRDRISCRG